MKLRNFIFIMFLSLIFMGCETELKLNENGNFIKSLTDTNSKPNATIHPVVHESYCYKFVKNNSNFFMKENLSEYRYSLTVEGNIKDLNSDCVEEVRNGVYLIGLSGKLSLPSNAYEIHSNEMYIESLEGRREKSSIEGDKFLFSLNDQELNTYLRNNGLMKKSEKIDSVNRKYRNLIESLVQKVKFELKNDMRNSVTIYDEYSDIKSWSKESKSLINDFLEEHGTLLSRSKKDSLSTLSYSLSKINGIANEMFTLVGKNHLQGAATLKSSFSDDDDAWLKILTYSASTVNDLNKKEKLNNKFSNEFMSYARELKKLY